MMIDWDGLRLGCYFLESWWFWMSCHTRERERERAHYIYVRLRVRTIFRREGLVDEGWAALGMVFLDHLSVTTSTCLAFLSHTEVQLSNFSLGPRHVFLDWRVCRLLFSICYVISVWRFNLLFQPICLSIHIRRHMLQMYPCTSLDREGKGLRKGEGG
jgi:hypothetical protein